MPARRASSTLVMRPSCLKLRQDAPVDGIEHRQFGWAQASSCSSRAACKLGCDFMPASGFLPPCAKLSWHATWRRKLSSLVTGCRAPPERLYRARPTPISRTLTSADAAMPRDHPHAAADHRRPAPPATPPRSTPPAPACQPMLVGRDAAGRPAHHHQRTSRTIPGFAHGGPGAVADGADGSDRPSPCRHARSCEDIMIVSVDFSTRAVPLPWEIRATRIRGRQRGDRHRRPGALAWGWKANWRLQGVRRLGLRHLRRLLLPRQARWPSMGGGNTAVEEALYPDPPRQRGSRVIHRRPRDCGRRKSFSSDCSRNPKIKVVWNNVVERGHRRRHAAHRGPA